jgi:hypothetical protein
MVSPKLFGPDSTIGLKIPGKKHLNSQSAFSFPGTIVTANIAQSIFSGKVKKSVGFG